MNDALDLGGTHPPVLQRPLKIFTERQLDRIAPLQTLSAEQRFAMHVVAQVLPFRVNQYVVDELIQWDQVPDDPMFRLAFPQQEMLGPAHFARIADLLRSGASHEAVRTAAREIQLSLNPHPADQRTLNVPRVNDQPLPGVQHKYRETVLFFPSQGQTCHSYCTFCFRWPQFVGDKSLHMGAHEGEKLRAYLAAHPEVSDLLVTGGDPMVMKTADLAAYLEPLLDARFDHLQNLRIGTKALTWWPFRFLSDPDADDLLRLFERVVESGRHLALMAHFDHWRELEAPAARAAIRRVRDTGAVIRCQGPLLNHVNNDPAVWARLWREQVRLGMVPYYLFVERDTGARHYFEVPLARALEVYREAIQAVSGLARTVRGPSMSASPGKVEVQGVAEVAGEQVFVLRFIQGRNPDWVERPFFARFDPAATWLNDLRPAHGAERFFFEEEYLQMRQRSGLDNRYS